MRRSPNQNAKHIDLFDKAAEKNEGKFVWQFMTYDANPYIAHNIFYWDSFDEQEHAKFTRLFKEYKAATAVDGDRDGKRVVDTEWRHPGRSDKWWDQHSVNFETFFEVNKKEENKSPHRAVRVVMVEPILDLKDVEEMPSIEIDDNNQFWTFQFHDEKKGWKFFCPNLAGKLKQAVALGHTFKKLDSYFLDTKMWKVGMTKIEIDLNEKTQKGRNKRSIRAVWVTPVYQKGCDAASGTSSTQEPTWTEGGPRFEEFGPPAARSQEGAARSQEGAAAASAATAPGEKPKATYQ